MREGIEAEGEELKAFQCSQCANLQLNENGKCSCHAAMPDPRWRDKSDKQSCLDAFRPLPQEKQWHERFYWE